ncbi:MAG: orotidine-5'-phosphate decarboxylase [Planctomycetes bacterium]|nr:orotidine-5'-phosphate decarboxylase [Planctomycetota bacterium]
MTDLFSQNKIIVALDGMVFEKVLGLVDELRDYVWGFKFNDLLFHPKINELLSRTDLNFFVDAKLHDIPNTVKNQVKRLVAEYNPALLTVHASGGPKMLEAAVNAVVEEGGRTGILAVTVLTSIDDETSKNIYGAAPAEKVAEFARISADAGVFGCICSPHEVKLVSQHKLHSIVPGIRPIWFAQADDQSRIATPARAIKDGASAIVVGRAITKANNMVEAAIKTADECKI